MAFSTLDTDNLIDEIEEKDDIEKEPEVKEEKLKRGDDCVDLNIAGVQKTRIRVNKDDNAILELNLSDMRIAERLEKGYNRLQENIKKVSEMDVENDDVTAKLHEVDVEMRDIIDYIFNGNVSAVCCKDGTMFDLSNGEFRFENIIGALVQLYSDTLSSEYNSMKKRVQTSANKYITQDHKSRSKKRRETIQKDE